MASTDKKPEFTAKEREVINTALNTYEGSLRRGINGRQLAAVKAAFLEELTHFNGIRVKLNG